MPKIVATNPTPFPRHDVVTVGVPCEMGTFRPGSSFTIDGRAVQSKPFGPMWPDGSHRTVRAQVPVTLGADEDQEITLEVDTDRSPRTWPFAFHANITREVLLGLMARVTIGGHELNLLQGLVPVDAGYGVMSWESFNRRQETWVWFHVQACNGMPFVKWWLHWGVSSREDHRRSYPAKEINLDVSGAHLVLHHHESSISKRRLMWPGSTIGDGQSQMLSGRLLFGGPHTTPLDESSFEAETLAPVSAIADWTTANCYSPFGVVPPGPPGFDVSRDASKKEAISHFTVRPNMPWGPANHIAAKDPGQPGFQHSFGVTAFGQDVRRVSPHRLYKLLDCVYREANRPAHHIETDGQLVREINHPKCVFDRGTPHSRSTDTLGKDAWAPKPTLEDWKGYDRQHYVQTALFEYAILTQDVGARRLCDFATETWLFSNPNTQRGTSHDTPDEPRGVGRPMSTGAWILLLNNRTDVEKRLLYIAKEANKFPHKRVVGPDSRVFGGLRKFWSTWQALIEAKGYYHVAYLLKALYPEGNYSALFARAHAITRMVLPYSVIEGGVYKVPYAISEDGTQELALGDWEVDWGLASIEMLAHLEGDDQAKSVVERYRNRASSSTWDEDARWEVGI